MSFLREINHARPFRLMIPSPQAPKKRCDICLGLSLTANKIITARKRSSGQGNIFTPVCHSVHGGGCVRGWGGMRGSPGGGCAW